MILFYPQPQRRKGKKTQTEPERGKTKLTDKRQPDKLEPDNSQDGEGDPGDGLGVQGEPEEAGVGGVDDLGAGLAALEDPLAVARGAVDLVPPAQAHEPAAGDVLEVVEVGREQQDRDDEDEHHVVREDDPEEVHEEGGCRIFLFSYF